MILVRNIAFMLVFCTLSVPIVMLAPVSAWIGGTPGIIAHASAWTRFHGWAVRVLLGITVRVEGEQPSTPVFYAAKHQAMWETLDLQSRLGGPSVVLKRELTRIPCWGWVAVRYGCIPVDREASAGALRSMVAEARTKRAEGRSVLIFPEGTRVAPGERPPLKAGFAGLYRALAMPTVPIATNSGLVWPRRGLKRPGVIVLRFGAPIPPGLPRAEAEARVHAAMNALEA